MVKISVIMAVYNSENFLAQAIESVLSQSLREIELICVNDGSTDGSLVVLDEYANKDERVHVFSHENQGASYARNIAFANAKGEYLHILDGDDMVPEGAYKRMYEKAKRDNLDMLFFDAQVLFDNPSLAHKYPEFVDNYRREREYGGITTGKELFCRLSEDDVYRTQASMYLVSREFLRENNIRFMEGITHEDVLFTFLCMMQAKRVTHINEALFIRRVRENSTMTSPVKFENVIGQLTCFDEMYRFASVNITDERTKKAAVRMISISAKSGILNFSQLSDEERKRVDSSSFGVQMFVEAFGNRNGSVIHDGIDQVKMNSELKKEVKYYRESLSWKITKPLRCVRKVMKLMFGR